MAGRPKQIFFHPGGCGMHVRRRQHENRSILSPLLVTPIPTLGTGCLGLCLWSGCDSWKGLWLLLAGAHTSNSTAAVFISWGRSDKWPHAGCLQSQKAKVWNQVDGTVPFLKAPAETLFRAYLFPSHVVDSPWNSLTLPLSSRGFCLCVSVFTLRSPLCVSVSFLFFILLAFNYIYFFTFS